MIPESKVFIDVIAKFSNGKIIPLSIIWTDGRTYEIDKVLDTRKAASLKGGGVGTRYLVKIRNQEKYLFFDENLWFIEK